MVMVVVTAKHMVEGGQDASSRHTLAIFSQIKLSCENYREIVCTYNTLSIIPLNYKHLMSS